MLTKQILLRSIGHIYHISRWFICITCIPTACIIEFRMSWFCMVPLDVFADCAIKFVPCTENTGCCWAWVVPKDVVGILREGCCCCWIVIEFETLLMEFKCLLLNPKTSLTKTFPPFCDDSRHEVNIIWAFRHTFRNSEYVSRCCVHCWHITLGKRSDSST